MFRSALAILLLSSFSSAQDESEFHALTNKLCRKLVLQFAEDARVAGETHWARLADEFQRIEWIAIISAERQASGTPPLSLFADPAEDAAIAKVVGVQPDDLARWRPVLGSGRFWILNKPTEHYQTQYIHQQNLGGHTVVLESICDAALIEHEIEHAKTLERMAGNFFGGREARNFNNAYDAANLPWALVVAESFSVAAECRIRSERNLMDDRRVGGAFSRFEYPYVRAALTALHLSNSCKKAGLNSDVGDAHVREIFHLAGEGARIRYVLSRAALSEHLEQNSHLLSPTHRDAFNKQLEMLDHQQARRTEIMAAGWPSALRSQLRLIVDSP